MYEAFYGLRTKPFSILPDPEFLYWARPHSMAFAMLEYGIMNHAGFTVITGEIGSGKTTLVRHLLTKLPGDIRVGLITNTQSDRGDLLQWLMASLEQEFSDRSYVALYKDLERFLIREHQQGRRVVVIVDEAQNLDARSIEELRMVSNISTNKSELMQIILVGQPELKAMLSRPELIQFAQRISSDFHLVSLAKEDVPAYIDHRLVVAGADHLLFTDEACALIARATGGTPRLINVLCDTALVYGYGQEAEVITAEIVQTVIDDKRRYGIQSVEPSLNSRLHLQNQG